MAVTAASARSARQDFEQTSAQPTGFGPANGLREVIVTHDALPEAVRSADFGYVESRILQANVLDEITSQAPLPHLAGDWSERLQRRRAALEPYLGRLLVCVLIRVPGTHYTIELDPDAREVVYWEWQPYSHTER